ncbi:hypothetical protein VPHD249_0093 [Vibrio phage D249]|nr:hypothetical protein SIPHO036v1_100002 [Vibrio phage 70E38.1]QZI87993.1 hypothetical protein SIPHO041v1_p0082 [Vibrio phage 234P1]QZI88366.1 hypothetical protein SIPHO082v1_p0089 [Vibrio phage 294E48.1]QZI88533.1 hypothetical protein SIPHO037v1_p0092 [Vibrio phage 70E35.2]QZI88718.1 hypothetical protein SIPHO039v1_p0089 [Vibrio phage 70E35.5a]QZI88901.1 hypothetical protein SIPHO040v1_p0088 [Vibrio phage 70E35.6]QZI89120.1 hypothetical protein SIPHO042v1_p0123 [Vibrio phage 70E37.1]QZI893
MKCTMLALLIATSGCAIKDETLFIAGDLITVQMRDNRPDVDVSTGLDECKWDGSGNVLDNEYELVFKCKFPTQELGYGF